jgi:PIN domain nuclease of toxin-antitoxin system
MRRVLRAENLPFHRRDSFDRLLIAQSPVEGLPILAGDAMFSRYSVEDLW